MSRGLLILACSATLLGTHSAPAQHLGTLNPRPLPPLANPNDPTLAAKELFVRKRHPAALEPRVYGFYNRGCVAGAVELPVTGETWQVMRLSRHRNFGHPNLIAFLKRFSAKVPEVSDWKGILVGDLAQPRGGPMYTGHASHQVGLDADIWLRPMPDRELTRQEREEMLSTNVVAQDRRDIDPAVWTRSHHAVIKAAAQDRAVQRVFVNPAIKKALCREADGNRGWLSKVRPIFGHNYHFHVRLGCPRDSPECKSQPPPPAGDGCDDLDWWFSDAVLHPKPSKVPPKPRPPLRMADLPVACRAVLAAP